MASERKLNAMIKLACDAGVKISNAAKLHDENPLEAEYKLMFAIAENTSVIAGLMLDVLMEEDE